MKEPYSCEFCNFNATKKSNRKIHVKSFHKGIKNSCDFCDCKATLKSNLKEHAKSVHEGVYHNCELCGYKSTLPWKASLKNHV